MPTWHEPPSIELNNALSAAVSQLEVDDDPPFEEVTGIEQQDMVVHAVDAIRLLIAGEIPTTDLDTLVQLYCLGFVVGMKHGENRVRGSDT